MNTLHRQFLHFAAVGLVGTGLQYLTLWAGVEYLGMAAAMASAIGYVFGAVANYLLNYSYTFKGTTPHVETASKYFTVVGIGWVLNTALMALLAHVLGWQYFLAQILTTGIALGWNFVGSRFWVFRRSEHDH